MSRLSAEASMSGQASASPPEARPAHALADDWVEEGFRQLLLTLLWERLASALERREGATLNLAVNLRREVIEPNRREMWLSGARDLVGQLATGWKEGKKAGYVPAKIREIQERYVRLWAGKGQTPATLHDFRDPLADHLSRVLDTTPFASSSSSPAGLPDLGSLKAAPAVWSARWIAQAIALDAWKRRRTEARRRGQDDARLIDLKRLVKDCGEIAAWGEEWRRGSSPFASALGLAKAHNDALGLVTNQLTLCRESIEKLLAEGQLHPSEDNLREREGVIDEIDAILADAPRSWPAHILADFQARLRDVDPANLGSFLALAAKSPQTVESPSSEAVDARTGLVAALTSALDGMSGVLSSEVSTLAWRELEEAASRLLEGSGARVKFARDPARAPQAFTVDHRLEIGQPTRVLVSAVTLEWPGTTRAASTVRTGKAEAPRAMPEAASLLLRVIEELPRGHLPDFAERGRSLALGMQGHRNLGEWWQSLAVSKDLQGPLWRVIQGLASIASTPGGSQSSALQALELFAEAGFRLEALPTRASQQGPLRVALDARSSQTSGRENGPRLGLRMPGGDLFQPEHCLVLPSTRAGHPMVDALVNAGDLLEGLRKFDHGWEGWDRFNHLVWDLAFRPTDVGDEIDPGIARDAFEAVYRRSLDPHATARVQHRELSGLMSQALERMGLAVVPALEPGSWRPAPVKVAPRDGTVIHWSLGGKAFGEVEVVRFGVGASPAELRVSLGPQVSEVVARWSVLPVPSFTETFENAGGGWSILDWHREANRLPFLDPTTLAETMQQARQRFAEWVKLEPGRAWFDAIVNRAITEPHGSSWNWVDSLLSEGWCECTPAVNANGLAYWPHGRSASEAPRATWEWDDRTPLGQAIAGSFRYAPALALLQARFSLGPKDGGSLALAEEVLRAVQAEPSLKSWLEPAAGALWNAYRDARIGGQAVADVVSLVLPLIDGMTNSAEVEPASWDRLLAALVRFCAAQGLAILPENWTFSHPSSLADQAQPPIVEFSNAVARGQVHLRQFGLKFSKPEGSTIRAASLFRSAGRRPDGLVDLRTKLAESPLPWAAGLIQTLDGWPAVALENADALALEARFFFKAFWDRATTHRPEEVEPLSKVMERLLADEFGLKTFRPRTTIDYPGDHVQVKVRGPQDRGKVAKVLRPGLIHDVDGLCFPAQVEVE